MQFINYEMKLSHKEYVKRASSRHIEATDVRSMKVDLEEGDKCSCLLRKKTYCEKGVYLSFQNRVLTSRGYNRIHIFQISKEY